MSDQVSRILSLAPQHQLGRPPAGGVASCTDNVACLIVEVETGRRITPLAFRRVTGHVNDATGLTAAETLRGLAACGVRGYGYRANVTASDVLRATDRGVVLVGVGYGGYPTRAECQVGGKADLRFRGAHAIAVMGRRLDPDHSQTDPNRYDRFVAALLTRAMCALVTDTPWSATFMLAKEA